MIEPSLRSSYSRGRGSHSALTPVYGGNRVSTPLLCVHESAVCSAPSGLTAYGSAAHHIWRSQHRIKNSSIRPQLNRLTEPSNRTVNTSATASSVLSLTNTWHLFEYRLESVTVFISLSPVKHHKPESRARLSWLSPIRQSVPVTSASNREH